MLEASGELPEADNSAVLVEGAREVDLLLLTNVDGHLSPHTLPTQRRQHFHGPSLWRLGGKGQFHAVLLGLK